MTDVIDQGCEQEAFFLASALSEQAKKPRMRAVGKCWNCDESLSAGELFCDADCRDDYQRRDFLNKHGRSKNV